MDTHGAYDFKVRSYECSKYGIATLPTICNYLQEAASLSAEELKFSKSNFAESGNNISWVLTRLRVKMSRYPRWGENVCVLTFPRGGRKITAWRDFVLYGSGGSDEVIGCATSEWMIIDLSTRKIVPVPQRVFALANTEREPVLGTSPFAPKLKFPESGTACRMEFKAQNSHIDLNGHVNNSHYVEWLMEPFEGGMANEFEIVFRSETFAGEKVVLEVAKDDDGVSMHRVSSADGETHAIARISPAAAP
ncbi:MAG: hypothetical protein J6P13_00160 [Kiritimatiellae bacterium]|nr:hypothetical protein [Kiritimatiellia bacterium]